MKKIIRGIAIMGAAAAFTTGIALGAPMNVKVKNIVGKVESQSGPAWKTVAEGGSVEVGAPIRTGPGSSCVLVWAGGNTVKLGPLTNMKVSSVEKDASGKENSMLDLKSGKLVAHAKKLPTKGSSFKVSTPTAVAGVRGTDEVIETQESGESSFGVAEGSVELESGGQIIVLDEGFMVDVDSIGAMTEPEAIPAEMMEELKEDLKEVNAEAKQAEAEAGGSSEAAPAGEKKESAAGGGEEKKESAAGGGEKSEKEESAAGGGEKAEKEESADESQEEPAGGEDVDTDAATANIDSAMDTAVNSDVTETATDAGEESMITGDVDITIEFTQ